MLRVIIAVLKCYFSCLYISKYCWNFIYFALKKRPNYCCALVLLLCCVAVDFTLRLFLCGNVAERRRSCACASVTKRNVALGGEGVRGQGSGCEEPVT